MTEEKPILNGGAHAALIIDQVKWSPHPDGKSAPVFYINFDVFITKEELVQIFADHFGTTKDWRITPR